MLALYAIYDELANMWSNPFALNTKTAMRTFTFMAKDRQESDCKDQKIYQIAKYNKDTGEITVLEKPYFVLNLEEEWKRQHG